MITLWSFQALELYFVSTHLKKIYQKKYRFQKFSQNCYFGLVRSTAMIDRWQSRTALSVDRAVDRHAPICMCAHRSTVPVDRQKEQSSLFVPVDRQRVFTLCLGTSVDHPVNRFPNGQKFDRWRSTGLVDRQQTKSADWLPMAISSFVFCWGFSQRIYWLF